MASDRTPSLSADLARVVLLALAFDAARVVVQELRCIDSSRSDNAGEEGEGSDQQAARDGAKRQDSCVDAAICKSDGAPENDGAISRTNLGRWRRHISMFIGDRKRAGLCLYALLPPPLLLYGAWDFVLFKRNKQLAHNASLLGGAYLSTVTSFGLLLWVCPELLSRGNSDGEGVNGAAESAQQLAAKQQDAAEALVKVSPLPSAIFRPPLAPVSNELERRPRGDSLASECSVTQTISTPVVETAPKKYLEILVHNVSHTDLILGLCGDQMRLGMRAASVPFPAEFEDTPRKMNTSPDNTATGNEEKYIMCRPRFSAFDMFSRRVLGELQGQIESTCSGETTASDRHPLHQKIISYPRYERSTKTARYTLVTPRPSDQYMLPVGFNLERAEGINNTAVDASEMPSLRLRGRDIPRVDPSLLGETPRKMDVPPRGGMQTPSKGALTEALRVNAVFFPLLATLLPRWLGQISDTFGDKEDGSSKVAAPLLSPHVKKVVVLVSGVGSPRNWTHSVKGNSTQACAEIMELFLHALYPDITVVRIHSETNIFRYDENITFATQELMPCIDAYRDAHARSEPYPDEMGGQVASSTERSPFNPDWRQSCSVTYSFADGSAARSHAIQAALRPYRPTYFHFWQLKTFWHESKITDEDIEVHSFEEMETEPAMAVDQTTPAVAKVVNEMKAFRREFIETLKDGGRSDLKSFWLRKTKKPVLAVLLVQKPDGTQVLYRGTNMEVSMPTGSLCAERNVIGTALASDPGLKREDLLMVAVLSIQLPGEALKRPSPPPGPMICRPIGTSSSERAEFAKEVEDRLNQHQAQGDLRPTASTSSFASIAEEGPKRSLSPKPAESEEWEMDAFDADKTQTGVSPLASPSLLPATGAVLSPSKTKGTVMIPELSLARAPPGPPGNASGSSTPKRRISLYQKRSHSKMGGGVKRKKEPLLLQSPEDINPLKPCGACNEWLKKIAESNPHFKVLTFTDTQCNGVYVSPCQE
ncbi:hypothetical protein ACHAXT_001120 [Thalassiosira profunda]